VDNQVRLPLFVRVCNLGSFLPQAVFHLAAVSVPRDLFRGI
jgi:hypothetical protein